MLLLVGFKFVYGQKELVVVGVLPFPEVGIVNFSCSYLTAIYVRARCIHAAPKKRSFK